MMFRKMIIGFLLFVPIFIVAGVIDYVDPMIGTDGSGHTYPGAATPFGMIQLSPDTDIGGWKRCSGYHYSDSTIVGFSHTHISGTGVGDLGDIMLMPFTGKVVTERGHQKDPDSGYRSRFSHTEESASPGYYTVLLKDYDIQVELTAAQRAGMHRYTFPKTNDAHVIIDLTHLVKSWSGKTAFSRITFVNDSTITGYRLSDSWAEERHIYFAARFSRPFKSFGIADEKEFHANLKECAGPVIKGVIHFDMAVENQLLVKVAVSHVDVQGALNNLDTAIPHWNFDQVRAEAEELWEKELSCICIKADKKTMTVFYTAMYHTMLAPILFHDADGRYTGQDRRIHQSKDFTNYTVFSLWDTFRALHPWFTIMQQKRSHDFIQSMLAHYQQNVYGVLPKWSLCGNETWCMIGYHAVPVIADALLKGIGSIDAELAFQAMISSATTDYEGIGAYMKYGYVPIDLEKEAASKTLEYAFDDWCIAQVAKVRRDNKQYQDFIKRSGNYQYIYDAKSGFMRVKDSKGQFTTLNPSGEFDPVYAHYGHDYTEGNAWQYTWFVPHAVPDLIELMGGSKAFIQKLDQLFSISTDKNENSPHDISGLIGQYAHGNEPSHHVAYLYNYAGVPWKTQERVHQILTTLYDTGPNGLCGNEDCGQMSAWYLFSALGFYPVNPSNSIYVIGTPYVKEAKLQLENGNQFKVIVNGFSSENLYIQSVKLNGKAYNQSWIHHQDIMNGGTLVFTMGKYPNKKWAAASDARPPEKGF